MIVKLIMLRLYTIILTILLVLNCMEAQEKPSALEGIDLRIIGMYYDWANLARYEDKNKEVVIDQNDDRVVFMGNSITEGWKKEMPTMFDLSGFKFSVLILKATFFCFKILLIRKSNPIFSLTY